MQPQSLQGHSTTLSRCTQSLSVRSPVRRALLQPCRLNVHQGITGCLLAMPKSLHASQPTCRRRRPQGAGCSS